MIKIEGYSKKYGRVEAVKNLDLEIMEGETFALLGPNGSGKTTIIKSIVGLSRPTTGKIYIEGNDPWKDPEVTRASISYLPQRVTLPDNLKVGEVLSFFSKIKKAPASEIDTILDYLAVTDDMGQYVGNLSGGMLQRLGLVISFIGDPRIIVMDEPTLNLDLTGMKSFRRYINLLKDEGKTILFSSHSLADAEQMSERVGIIVDGELKAVESLGSFKERIKSQIGVILVLSEKNPNLVDLALNKGAVSAAFQNGYFLYSAERSRQIGVLDAIRDSGVEILSIRTEHPSLDKLVEEYYE